LVDEDLLDDIFFQLHRDDHGVILLVIEAMKIVIYEGYEGHTTSVVGVGDMVDGLYMAEVSLSSG